MSFESGSAERAVADQVGANVARCRRQAGLSQQQVADRAAMHRSHVGFIERGKRLPRIDTAIKLADVLGVTPDEFWRGIQWRRGTTDDRGNFSTRDPSQ